MKAAEELGAGLPSPVSTELVGWYGAVANVVLFYCTYLDFAFVGVVLNNMIQRSCFPTFSRDFSLANLPALFLLTLPSFAFAFGMSILTPRLDSLAGFLESLCVPTVMLIAPPLPAVAAEAKLYTAAASLTLRGRCLPSSGPRTRTS